MRKSTFMFSYDELPLVIHNGIEAALINGKIVVEYNREGEWGTGQVLVEGYGPRDPVTNKTNWVYVPAPAALALMIVYRLEHEWESKVQEAVNESLKLESALARLRTSKRIALLHYAPIVDTVVGEPPFNLTGMP